MSQLNFIHLPEVTLVNGIKIPINLSCQVFGDLQSENPVVLVIHALTGNSNVSGANGWWNDLIGPKKIIDTNRFTVLAFNIPGNGYDGKEENLIDNMRKREIIKPDASINSNEFPHLYQALGHCQTLFASALQTFCWR